MAAIDDLLQKIQDPVLRERLSREIRKVTKRKKFGLVYEEHLPECTLLYDVPVRKGSRAAVRGTDVREIYTVLSIADGKADCISNISKDRHVFPLSDLVTVVEFGEPVYPCLQAVDAVCNAPDSGLWHTLIEADNYHALQLLGYMYAGQVDCIYIDPPYNKEDSKDWKYNCNYVDGNDMYRHSKWLSMMERRLELAKRLLNTKNSALIVSIDEQEYLHLGMLLEQIFPEARIQMISSVINPAGAVRKGEFSRTNEYIYFLMFGDAAPSDMDKEDQSNDEDVHWNTLRRTDLSSVRLTRPRQFYPIYIDNASRRVKSVGAPLLPGESRYDAPVIEGCTAVFPVRPDGTEMNWGITGGELMERAKKGYVKVGKYSPESHQKYVISYLKAGPISDIETGKAVVVGYDDVGAVICRYKENKGLRPTTQWNIKSHDAYRQGTNIIANILGKGKFTFPKSVYAEKDAISLFVKDNPNALIVDFFAGSGTTLHAVNLINAEDNGNRRCIMVTNNEIGEKAEKKMLKAGFHPGDKEWEDIGIARNVTWPRTVCSIEGHDINGNPLKGKYLGSDMPMSEGFKANAAFFKLGFLDKNSVALGRQFRELLPVLWMKAGSVGPCPHLDEGDDVPGMMILPQNRMAVLNDDFAFAEFEQRLQGCPEIETVYIVTDSDRAYREMIHSLDVRHTFQLYRDYLDSFKINHRR